VRLAALRSVQDERDSLRHEQQLLQVKREKLTRDELRLNENSHRNESNYALIQQRQQELIQLTRACHSASQQLKQQYAEVQDATKRLALQRDDLAHLVETRDRVMHDAQLLYLLLFYFEFINDLLKF
jgi:DNA repair exonuclease SbcCD ATPase subunit